MPNKLSNFFKVIKGGSGSGNFGHGGRLGKRGGSSPEKVLGVTSYGLEISNVSPDLWGDGKEVVFMLADNDKVEGYLTKIDKGIQVRLITEEGDLLLNTVVDNLDAAATTILENRDLYKKELK